MTTDDKRRAAEAAMYAYALSRYIDGITFARRLYDLIDEASLPTDLQNKLKIIHAALDAEVKG